MDGAYSIKIGALALDRHAAPSLLVASPRQRRRLRASIVWIAPTAK
jgi:hypothetical protein